MHVVDLRAVLGDETDRAVLLPQRVGLALLEVDHEVARIELGDRGFLDERDRGQAIAQRRGIEQQQGVARPDAGDGEDLGLGQLVRAGDGDGPDVEARGLGEHVRHGALRLDELAVLAALHRAEHDGADEQAERERGAEVAGVDQALDAVAHGMAARQAPAREARGSLRHRGEGERVERAGVGEGGGRGREPRAQPA